MLARIKFTFALLLAVLLAAPASAQDPYSAEDNTWISISGTVDTVEPDNFILDYGEARIMVEMDDWDADADGYKVVPGDKVTVSGIIDDDFFERTTIEASSVYVEGLNTYFYASAADEEDAFVTLTVPPVASSAVIQGRVTAVNHAESEFTVDAGLNGVTVKTDVMPYDPLDTMGPHNINVGDVVSVMGELDYDFLEGREMVATSITTLSREPM
jgi:uncharacterized protein YdeI (BOF family)